MRFSFSRLCGALCALMISAASPSAPVFAQDLDPRRDVVSMGVVNGGAAELYLRRVERPFAGALQPVYGLSVTTRGQAWIGGGLAYGLELAPGGAFLRASFMPGLQVRGRGRDLGGPVAFRSGLELGVPLGRGEVTLGIDHRSNAGIHSRNPGLNSLYLSYTLRRF